MVRAKLHHRESHAARGTEAATVSLP